MRKPEQSVEGRLGWWTCASCSKKTRHPFVLSLADGWLNYGLARLCRRCVAPLEAEPARAVIVAGGCKLVKVTPARCDTVRKCS